MGQLILAALMILVMGALAVMGYAWLRAMGACLEFLFGEEEKRHDER